MNSLSKIRKRSVAFAGLLLSSGSLVVGCSLTGVTDIQPGVCEVDKDCWDALNPELDLPLECASFECRSNGTYNQCFRIEKEICDSLDNDCDGLIDEPSDDSKTSLIKTSITTEVEGVLVADSATYATSENLTRLYVQQDKFQSSLADEVTAVDLQGTTALAASPMGQRSNEEEDIPPNEETYTELANGCHVPGDLNQSPTTSCSLGRTVTSAGSGMGFYASLNTTGCTSGELHVGVIDPNEPTQFIDRGRGFRSPAYRGVSTGNSRCSDNGTSACKNLKTAVEDGTGDSSELHKVCGVSQLAVDAIDIESADGKSSSGLGQALVGFLGVGLGNASCEGRNADGDAVAVLALTLHGREGNWGDGFVFGDPSGDGVPDEVGRTRGGSPPAIVGIENQGHLLAYSDAEEDDKIHLKWVPKQAASKNTGIDCPTIDSGTGREQNCDIRVSDDNSLDLRTESIGGVRSLKILDSGGRGDGVRMSLLSLKEKKAVLALTWIDGCAIETIDAGNAPAYAQLLHLDLEPATPMITFTGARISIGETSALPLSVTSEEAFVTEGLSRNEQEAVAGELGGFYVVTQKATPQAIRVAAFDGARVHGEESITFGDEEEVYFTSTGTGSLASHDPAAGAILQREFSCSSK